MSRISTALDNVSTHRELVPAYYYRPGKCWIITGVGRTNGGAVVIDDDGQLKQAFSSKRDALRSITQTN